MKFLVILVLCSFSLSQSWLKRDIDSKPIPKEYLGEWYLNGQLTITIQKNKIVFPHSKNANYMVRKQENSFLIFEYYTLGNSKLKLIARKGNNVNLYISVIVQKSGKNLNYAKKFANIRMPAGQSGLPNLSGLRSFNADQGYALLHRKAGYIAPKVKPVPKPWKTVSLPKKLNGKWFTKSGLKVYTVKSGKISHGKKTYTIKEVTSNTVEYKIVAKVKGKKKHVALFFRPDPANKKKMQAGISNQVKSFDAAKKLTSRYISRFSKLSKK
jgi:hypothetical protein